MSTREKLGELLRGRRDAQGLTLLDVSTRVGCTVSFLCDVEHGRRRPGMQTTEKLADALGVPSHELLTRLLQERLDDDGLHYRVTVRR